MAKFKQGWFKPRNPDKYLGDPTKIRFMSSWEQRFQEFLDNNEHVIAWGSEEIAIPYYSEIDKKVHRYFPDFYVRYRDKYGHIKEEVIEVKPKSQLKLKPSAGLYEKLMFVTNMAKWSAAKKYCDERGLVFRVLTEDILFPKPTNVEKKNGN